MVHYRSFTVPKGSPETLESLCRSALAEKRDDQELWRRPADRVLTISEEGKPERQFLMNRVADLSSAMFGEVCAANDHDLQAMLKMDTRTEALTGVAETVFFDLAEAHAPDGSRFIRGIGYWFAIGNNLFFITLQSFTAKQLSTYLAWLIGQVAESKKVPLTDDVFQLELDVSVIGPDSVGRVKKLRIRGNSPMGLAVDVPSIEDSPADGTPVRKRRRYARKVRREHAHHERAMDIARAALGPANAESLLSSLGPDEYVAAEAEISIRGTRTDATLENVKRIASAISDETDAHIEVEGSMGKIRDGDAILRMRMPFEIANEGGTLLDFDNVADQIQKVYSRFVEDGKIDP